MSKRIFRTGIIVSLLLFACAPEVDAQVGKAASKAVEKLFKKSGKKVAKEGAEKIGKEAVIDASGKLVEKKVVEKSAKNLTVRRIEKDATKLEKKEVKDVFSHEASKAVNFATDAIRISATKNILEAAGKSEAKTFEKVAEKYFIKGSFAESGEAAISRELKKSAGNKAAVTSASHKTVSEKTVKQAEEKAAKMTSKGKTEYFEKLIKKKARKHGLSEEQQKKLLKDILADSDLADLIRKNPDFNISRWVETMKSVDKSKLAKLSNGKYPINYQYAGKRFYFDPALNKNVKAQLAKKGTYNGYTKEELKALDKMFPNGVPFDEMGFPDFVKAGMCKKLPNGADAIVEIPGGFTGVREKDFELARKALREKGITVEEFGYIWHHLPGEPPRIALIKTEAHEIIKHTGGHSIAKSVVTRTAQKGAEEAVEQAAKQIVARSLKECAASDKEMKLLYNAFSTRISKDFADGVIVNTTENGIELFSKNFPNSRAIMQGNTIIAKGGSLQNSGPVNEFLNHLLPNKRYIVDDAFEYVTDDLGRVASCKADRNKAFSTITRNYKRNSDVQRQVIESLDGKVGVDDASHLFSNTSGGPNELVNQIPMSRYVNRAGGLWRELEVIEENALKDGKQVKSQRRLLYNGKDKRPYAIEFTSEIDGISTSTIVETL